MDVFQQRHRDVKQRPRERGKGLCAVPAGTPPTLTLRTTDADPLTPTKGQQAKARAHRIVVCPTANPLTPAGNTPISIARPLLKSIEYNRVVDPTVSAANP